MLQIASAVLLAALEIAVLKPLQTVVPLFLEMWPLLHSSKALAKLSRSMNNSPQLLHTMYFKNIFS